MQWGVLIDGRAAACGLTHSAITARRAERGHLHRSAPRACGTIGHPDPPWEGRLLAAVKACGPSALLSHYSAAELWGSSIASSGRGRHRPGASSRSIRRIRIHRTQVLAAIDARVHGRDRR